ncbi:MAG: hypothetical protein HKM96_12610 [Boseongicola sp.]|nr:hypothetical protein [Silicimonas sp.]NNF92226.1 hypothetical protein [Boseongicola sp.]RZV99703.1 MAG: hypothetical protein EX266_14730 [Paracoccaceae bacterium]
MMPPFDTSLLKYRPRHLQLPSATDRAAARMTPSSGPLPAPDRVSMRGLATKALRSIFAGMIHRPLR